MGDQELIRQARAAVKAGDLSTAEHLVREVKRRRGAPNVFSVKSAGYRYVEPARPGGESGSMASPLPGWSPDAIDFFGRPRR